MRVLHVIPSVSPVRGGPSQAVLEMVKALRQAHLNVEIATTNDNGPSLLKVPLRQCTDYSQVPVWFFSRFSGAIAPLQEFAFSDDLTQWLWQNAKHYDLLHIHAIFSYASTAAMAIARLQNIPYIVRPLGQLCEWSLQQSAIKKQIYLRLIERSNLNHSQALHLTSIQERQEVAQLQLRAPSFVLPHGLNRPIPIPNARQQLRQQLNLPADELVLLFLSRLHPKKGLEYLIPALSQLKHHRFTLVIAGRGTPDYEQYIESLLSNHGLNECTHTVGFVAGNDKNLLLQGADLFALTSHSENFGIAVLEAIAVGLPVLITPGVALAHVVQEQQLGYVTNLEIAAIATALNRYFLDPQAAKAMGQRARQVFLETYTWDKIAAQLIQIYEATLSHQLLTLDPISLDRKSDP